MTLETMILNPNADNYFDQGSPSLNWGISTSLLFGIPSSGVRYNTILKFEVPFFNGEVKSIKLRLYITSIATGNTIGVYLVDSPFDDLWIEGTSIAAIDPEGSSWNEYVRRFSWATPGGEFAADPIGVKVWQAADPINQWYEIDIPIDNFTPQTDKTYSFILTSPIDTILGRMIADSRGGTKPPEFVIEVEIDGFETPTLTAEAKSSTQIDISWPESDLNDDNFTHYLLEQSDTGVGGWTTLATITDKDTTSYQDTGVVVQGDVDDFDEDLDTYPNGRTKYYRISLVTNAFGVTGYGTANATTLPAIRPIKINSITPENINAAADWIDDNVLIEPYGIRTMYDYYDSADETLVQYIDRIVWDIKSVKLTGGWDAVAIPVTQDIVGQEEFDAGFIYKGVQIYLPIQLTAKIYDTGGLYRILTDDKTTQQYEYGWPAPCPIAVPSAPNLLNPPRLLTGTPPFAGGTITPIDFSFAAQQTGETIFEEDFAGSINDKWLSQILGGGSVQYLTSDHIKLQVGFSTNPAYSCIFKKFKKELDNSHNKYFDKYTGGYKLKLCGQMNDLANVLNASYLFIGHSGWDESVITSYSGVFVRFGESATTFDVYATDNIGTGGTRLLLSATISLSDNPMYYGNNGKYFYMEIIACPTFSSGVDGMGYFIMWNIGNTPTEAKNIDLLTLSSNRFWYVKDVTMPADEQTHYTGRSSIMLYKVATTGLFPYLNIYEYELEGRVNGEEYGVKNLVSGEVLPLSNSPAPQKQLFVSPDVSPELVLVEGRIRNEYGSQSRTGEVDAYQGETYTSQIPIGFLSVPKVGYTETDVLVDASQSIDPEGGVLIYKYDFGDTQTLETTQPSVSHQYSTAGTYTVKLIVEDEAGLLSVEVQATVKIYDAIDLWEEITLMSPWESINEGSLSGTSTTSHPELDYDTVQTMEGGNRVFSLTGQHHDPNGNTPLADRITNAEFEKDYFHMLYNQAKLITLDLVNFGKVRGVITDHKPAMAVDDQQAFQFSMTFQEIDIRQFGD